MSLFLLLFVFPTTTAFKPNSVCRGYRRPGSIRLLDSGGNVITDKVERIAKLLNLSEDNPLIYKIIISNMEQENKHQLEVQKLEHQLKVQKLELELQHGLEKQKLESEIKSLERNLLASKGAATCRGVFEFILKAAKEELKLKGKFNAADVCNSLQKGNC